MRLSREDIEKLREEVRFKGLSDVEVECDYFQLHDVSVEALLHAVKLRGLHVETHVFDWDGKLRR